MLLHAAEPDSVYDLTLHKNRFISQAGAPSGLNAFQVFAVGVIMTRLLMDAAYATTTVNLGKHFAPAREAQNRSFP